MPLSKGVALLAAAPLFAAGPTPAKAPDRLVMVVDRDDDDADKIADRDDGKVPAGPGLLVIKDRPKGRDPAMWIAPDTDNVRLVADGVPIAKGAAISPLTKVLALQARRPGVYTINLFGQSRTVSAFEIRAFDNANREVDFATSHASFERLPPSRTDVPPQSTDALRFMILGASEDIPTTFTFVTTTEAGILMDALQDVPVLETPCPADVSSTLTCGITEPIRVVSDDIDRWHPLTKHRSVKAALGGGILLQTAEGVRLQTLRVGGPRVTDVGAIERFRATLRMILVRPRPGGPPPLGRDETSALTAARAEVERAGLLWSACGIGFGSAQDLNVTIVDPPRSHLLAVGCDHGLPASGGTLHIRVEGSDVTVKVAANTSPLAAARALASAVNAVGFTAKVSENAPMNAGASGAVDVLVRKRDGALAQIEPPATGPISTDATLTACIGRVDLTDGLTHFGDTDAFAGTVEERTLLKAFDDFDPSTVEVLFVPGFAQGGRIGESFIMSDRSAIFNAVIEDRAAIRSDRAAFALAHELGHVLLDEPGHPDDFGPDTPTRLMDSDAANPTAFGPRRITVEECARAMRQTGPKAPVVILKPWPFKPIVLP
ncbi:MAG: hypothetical protein IPK82_18630 [Polyangiaceae bacterium]|nr:hypothetical protein [Polyangiaceae bacterium]